MDAVLKLLLAKKYDKLNFFDIARLLKLIELDSQKINISDKISFLNYYKNFLVILRNIYKI